MTSFTEVHISGVTLSLLLNSGLVNPSACDGLLFGQIKRRVRSEFRDDTDTGKVIVEEWHAYVTSFVCSSSLGSFYDATGQVQDHRLAVLCSPDRDPVLGWFCSRTQPGALAQPSMREQAVSTSLHGMLAGKGPRTTPVMPVLLALLTRRIDHNGATLSMGYRCFQQTARVSLMMPPPTLMPIELKVLSLVRHAFQQQGSHYMADACMMDACVRGGIKTDATASAALSATATSALQQVLQLENYQGALLKQLQGLAKQVSQQWDAVRQLQQANVQLMADLQALEAA